MDTLTALNNFKSELRNRDYNVIGSTNFEGSISGSIIIIRPRTFVVSTGDLYVGIYLISEPFLDSLTLDDADRLISDVIDLGIKPYCVDFEFNEPLPFNPIKYNYVHIDTYIPVRDGIEVFDRSRDPFET